MHDTLVHVMLSKEVSASCSDQRTSSKIIPYFINTAKYTG